EEQRKNEISDIRQNMEAAQHRPFVPWTLNAQQKTALGRILDKEVANKFVIPSRCLIGSTQSQTFLEDFGTFARSHGWNVSGSCLGGLRADLVGIYLAIPYPSYSDFGCPPAENATTLLNMLTRSNIQIHVGWDDKISCGEFWLGIANQPS